MGRPRWLLALLWAAAVVARGAETPAACALHALHALHDCQEPPGIVVPCGITRTHAAGPRCPSRLRLGGNQLRSFPQGARGRAVNRLSALSDASQLNPRIKVLDLSGSGLVNVTKGLRKLSALESLDVRGNKLASLQFLPEPCGLRKLEASWNKVSTLLGPLHQCVYLVKLNLGYNQLTSLPSGVFRGMWRLKLLVLTGNKISALPRHAFASLGKLRDLRLDKNELLHLPDGLFAGLRSLRNLTVQGNRLASLPWLGACCARLAWASFARNAIASAPKAALRPLLGDGGRRRVVELQGNPLRAQALRWVLRVRGLRTFVAGGACACGGVRFGRAEVRLCVAARCGRGAHAGDWVEAVRRSPPTRLFR